jgi:hypothetical protein
VPLGSGPGLYSFASNALYQWVNCDSAYQFMIGDTSARFEPNANDNYAVIIWQNGCVDDLSRIKFGCTKKCPSHQ